MSDLKSLTNQEESIYEAAITFFSSDLRRKDHSVWRHSVLSNILDGVIHADRHTPVTIELTISLVM